MSKKAPNSLTILGENIALKRRQMGFKTQEVFADRVGISRNSLAQIERGQSEGHINTRIAIADALKCRLSELYDDPEAKASGVPNVKDAVDLLRRFSELPLPFQKVVLALIYRDASLARDLGDHAGKNLKGLVSNL